MFAGSKCFVPIPSSNVSSSSLINRKKINQQEFFPPQSNLPDPTWSSFQILGSKKLDSSQLLKIKLLDMSELEEEEKRKNFMQQQVNYFEKVIQEGKSPGIA